VRAVLQKMSPFITDLPTISNRTFNASISEYSHVLLKMSRNYQMIFQGWRKVWKPVNNTH